MFENHKAKLNGLAIQRLIIERRDASDERKVEINTELERRYNKPHIYL